MLAFLLFAPLFAAEPLRFVESISLPKVQGRIDHLALDLSGQRLFVAALGNNSVEVIDLRARKVLRSIPGLAEPQGLAYIPELNRLYVACGGDGTLRVFDGSSYSPVHTVKLGGDADNVRYDQAAKLLYIGYGAGAIGGVDPETGRRVSDTKLDAHPESFQLEKAGPRIFVNVPNAHHLAVIDRTRHAVTAKWPVTEAAANYPMALDEKNRRLFIGCRKPPRLLVYDTGTGKPAGSAPICGDTDDLFYDSARNLLYFACGEGFLEVLDGARYSVVARLPTVTGARTGLFAPDLNRFYLAVRQHGSQGAEIRVFQAQ